jgi:hypothetical protein
LHAVGVKAVEQFYSLTWIPPTHPCHALDAADGSCQGWCSFSSVSGAVFSSHRIWTVTHRVSLT